jgi:hypothetical protein
MAEIKSFWVVTKPSKLSVIEDICFKANIRYMQNQFLGGLKSSEIIGIYQFATEAKEKAQKALKKVNK